MFKRRKINKSATKCDPNEPSSPNPTANQNSSNSAESDAAITSPLSPQKVENGDSQNDTSLEELKTWKLKQLGSAKRRGISLKDCVTPVQSKANDQERGSKLATSFHVLSDNDVQEQYLTEGCKIKTKSGNEPVVIPSDFNPMRQPSWDDELYKVPKELATNDRDFSSTVLPTLKISIQKVDPAQIKGTKHK